MNPYSRDYSRRCGFFYTSEKGGTGGGEGTLKQQLEAAQTRVADLEPKASAHDSVKTQLEEALTAKATLTTQLQEANSAKEKAEQELTTTKGHLSTAERERTEAQEARTKAEADLKTAEERAAGKQREVSARNGVDELPPKAPGAGDHTQKPQADASAPPAQRLAGFFKARG